MSLGVKGLNKKIPWLNKIGIFQKSTLSHFQSSINEQTATRKTNSVEFQHKWRVSSSFAAKSSQTDQDDFSDSALP